MIGPEWTDLGVLRRFAVLTVSLALEGVGRVAVRRKRDGHVVGVDIIPLQSKSKWAARHSVNETLTARGDGCGRAARAGASHTSAMLTKL